jgi:hypothetical protein
MEGLLLLMERKSPDVTQKIAKTSCKKEDFVLLVERRACDE